MAAHVQDVVSGSLTGAASFTVNITTSAGSLLTVGIEAYLTGNNPFSVSGITDTAGNNWVYPTAQQQQSPPIGGSYYSTDNYYGFAAAAYAVNAAAVTSVTVQFSTAITDIAFIFISEFSGVPANASLDAAASSNTLTSGTSIVTPAIVTSAVAGGIIVAKTADNDGYDTVGSPWTIVSPGSWAWLITTGPGTQQATFTGSSQEGNATAILAIGAVPAQALSRAQYRPPAAPRQIPPQVITGPVATTPGVASAGLATGTGTAQQPAAVITVSAGLATGTGTAQAPVPAVTATAGPATAAGTALQPSALTATSAAGAVQAAFTAVRAPQQIPPQVITGAPLAAVTADAGLATAAGTAQQPVPAVAPAAGLAGGTGTAQGPSAAITVPAGLASGTGTAQPPVPVVTADAGLAAGTGTGQPPVPVVIVAAGLASGTGTALQPTVNTSGNTTANAGLATATGAALQPVASVQPSTGLAAGAGTAQSPVPAIGASPALAIASGSAPQPVISVTVFAGLATGTGTALQPVVGILVVAAAGLASAAGAAQQPGISITVIAGLATGTGTAQQPSAGAGTLTVHAGLATAAGTAWQPVIPGYTGNVLWAARLCRPRWNATLYRPRWKAVLMGPNDIAASSLEFLDILWTAELAGTELDPTGQTSGQPQLAVQFAMPLSSGDPLAPAEPATWFSAAWLTGTNIRGYVAQGLLGPSPAPFQMTAGQLYDAWSQILGTPEAPRKFCGTVSAF